MAAYFKAKKARQKLNKAYLTEVITPLTRTNVHSPYILAKPAEVGMMMEEGQINPEEARATVLHYGNALLSKDLHQELTGTTHLGSTIWSAVLDQRLGNASFVIRTVNLTGPRKRKHHNRLDLPIPDC